MFELNSIQNLIADFDRGPYEQGELMMMALLPALAAVLFFWFGLKMQFNGKSPMIKWVAILPLIIGVFIGIAPTQRFYGDQVYQSLYGGTWKKGMMHSGAIWLSVLTAIALVGWNFWVQKQKFEEL